MSGHEMHCAYCMKKPEEITEYITAAKSDGVTPRQYVILNEGTYNRNTGHFYCTDCYVKLGMPDGKADSNLSRQAIARRKRVD